MPAPVADPPLGLADAPEAPDLSAALLSALLIDARGAVGGAILCIGLSPETAATIERLVDEFPIPLSEQEERIASVGGRLSPDYGALLLASTLDKWEAGSRQMLPILGGWLHAFVDVRDESEEWQRDLLVEAADALHQIARLQAEGAAAPSALRLTALGCHGIAERLWAKEHTDAAFSCSQAAVNFATVLLPAEREPLTALALETARERGTPDQHGTAAFRHAVTLLERADGDSSLRLAAFEGIEYLSQHLPTDPGQRKQIIGKLIPTFEQELWLRPLAVRFLLDPAAPVKEVLPGSDDVRIGFEILWSGPLEEWLRALPEFAGVAIKVEDERLRLQGTEYAAVAMAEWGEWSIDHLALRRAVPHHTSFLRERDRAQMLLVLHHEITHVYSMMGAVGLASLALRWAMVEQELLLWTVGGHASDTDEFVRKAPAPLPPVDHGFAQSALVALGEVEAGLEVARKLQLLEAAWGPWFEGLAILGELAAAPADDQRAYTPIANVVHQLVDVNPSQRAAEEGIEISELVTRLRAEAELMYADAIESIGGFRLGAYLREHHRKYLPGYLAVRAIVAAWRERLGSLTGAEAFRLLLHVTRFGAWDAIPDLGLSLDAFEHDLHEQMQGWMRWVASISADELLRVLESAGGSGPALRSGWLDGRYEENWPSEAMEAEVRSRVEAFGRQAMESLRGARANLDRVPDAEGDTLLFIRAMASSLENLSSEPQMFSGELIATNLARLVILPVGETRMPFWMAEEQNVVACLVRTTLEDRTNGTPSYDVVAFSLPVESFRALAEQVRAGETRMRITRVVDLLETVNDEFPGRGYGRNYLAFQCGEWLYLQPRGLFLGSSEVVDSVSTAIRARLVGNKAIELLERICAPDHPGARRTVEWLDSVGEPWLRDGGFEVDLGPWVHRVRDLAQEVISNGNGIAGDHAALAALHFALGDGDAAGRLLETGFEPLADYEPAYASTLVKLLHLSARSPAEVDSAPHVAAAVEQLWGPLLRHGAAGWDVTPPRSLQP